MRNPVFESSAKRRMRSFRAPLLMTVYGLFLIIVSGNALLVLTKPTILFSGLRVGIEAHIYLTVMQFALIILVAPALTAGTIAGERERQTLDLLLVSHVGPFRIALGKMLSSLCFIWLLILSSLPMTAVLLLFGGIRFADLMFSVLFLMVTAFGCCAIGIFCSALFKRTVTATVCAYLILFALGAGTLLLPLAFTPEDVVSLIYAQPLTTPATNGGILSLIPPSFYLNPAVGLFCMLVRQTGMLERTLESLVGYRGAQIFNTLGHMKLFEIYNMAVIAALGCLLIALAALFVKPSGRKKSRK